MPRDRTRRDPYLDALKGVLVMVMVIYHAMNYFVAAHAELYGYLRFVNGAFVFLAGYAAAAMSPADPEPGLRGAAAGRSLRRGFRLLALFTVLNLLIASLGLTSYKNTAFELDAFTRQVVNVYLVGDAPIAAFRILVPIAYLSVAAATLIAWPSTKRTACPVTFAAAAIYTLIASDIAPHPFFLLVGLVGLCLGSRRPAPPAWRVKNAVALVGALLLLTALMNRLSGNALSYALGTAAVLKLFDDALHRLDEESRTLGLLALVGRYSLLCYIAQIAILHALRIVLGVDLALAHVLAVCLLTSSVLVAGCSSLERLRHRSGIVDKTYRSVFG